MTRPHASYVADTRWDPEQYGKFEDDRLRSWLELLTRVRPEGPELVCDQGSVAGIVTRILG